MMEKFYCVGCKKHHDLEVLEATEQNGKGGSIRYSLRSVCPSGHKTNKLCKREIYEAYGAEVSEMAAEVSGMTVGVNLEALAPTPDEPESGVALVPEDSLMPEGSGRTIGSQSVSHNYTPFHSEEGSDGIKMEPCESCQELTDVEELYTSADGNEILCDECYTVDMSERDHLRHVAVEYDAETFIVYPELKNHLVAIMPDKVYGVTALDDGDFEMSVANRYMDEVIAAVSEYQMNEPEVSGSSGFLGSGFSKTTVAVATATLAVGLAYYFNRK